MILGEIHKCSRQRTRVGIAEPVEQCNGFASQIATTGTAAVADIGGTGQCDGAKA
jgi:hypothetical protein